MAHQSKFRRRVRFVETDAAGIVHFSNFFRFMEEAEDVFWKSIGQVVHGGGECGTLAWPRTDAQCQWFAPLKYDDEFEVHLRVAEKNDKTVVFAFDYNLIEGDTSQRVAEGRVTCICTTYDRQTGKMKAAPIPAEIDALIDVAPEVSNDE